MKEARIAGVIGEMVCTKDRSGLYDLAFAGALLKGGRYAEFPTPGAGRLQRGVGVCFGGVVRILMHWIGVGGICEVRVRA